MFVKFALDILCMFLECSNLRLTAPLQVDLKAINNFKKIKQLTWTQVKKLINKNLHLISFCVSFSFQTFLKTLRK